MYYEGIIPSYEYYLRTFVPSYLRTFVPSYLRTAHNLNGMKWCVLDCHLVRPGPKTVKNKEKSPLRKSSRTKVLYEGTLEGKNY